MRLLEMRVLRAVELSLCVGVLVALLPASAIAQSVRTSAEVAVIASDSVIELETVIQGIRSKGRAASQSDEDARSKRITMLESASSLLSGIAYEAGRGATASDTRTEMIKAARLLHHAYAAGQEAGEYPAASDLVAVEGLLRNLDAYYSPKSIDEQR